MNLMVNLITFKNLRCPLVFEVKKIFINLLLGISFPCLLFSQSDTSMVPVEFEFYKILRTPEVGVGVNGSFNNWGNNPDGTGNNKHLIAMENVGDNLWRVTRFIPLGKYEYKFVTYNVSMSGDTSVSTWITDPLNSDYGGPYNNSRLNVTDPMIYYLQPMNNTSTNNRTPDITAKISWAISSGINLSSINLLIDDNALPNAMQYFDTTSRVFIYKPSIALITKKYTVELSVQNNKGTSADLKSTFNIVNEIISAPYTFVFDPLSPNLKLVGEIEKVEIKGAFNNLGADPMNGPDNDGVYKYTAQLNIGVPNSYQYIINGGQYINDPDNPVMVQDFGTVAIKRVNPAPHFEVLFPRQSQLFNPGENISINAQLIESDSNYAIDNNSIKVFLDNNPVSISSVDSIERGVEVKSATFSVTGGRHQLKFIGSDTSGIQTQYLMTFGSFSENSGFHYVDADSDDTGPGNYTYPSFSVKGSADIKQVDISSNAANDSLIFTVTLGSVTDYTRLGFEIINSLNGSIKIAPDKAGIQIPDVSNKGIFFILTPPGSGQKSNYVNKIYKDLDLTTSTDTLVVNPDVESTGKFKFEIPLSLIENIAGSFTKGWYFLAYSYLGNSNGGWKVPQENGGALFSESPNIYDAAFFYNNSIEKRNLSNFNFSFNYGGSRYIKLASNLRGVQFIQPKDISDELASKPYINILTDGGNIRWSDSIRVYVASSDSSISSGILSVNSNLYALSFSGDTAYADIVLSEGINELQAYANYGQNLKSYSTKIFFNRIIDHKPKIDIVESINSGSVTLDASATSNIDKLTESFKWMQDLKNPELITFSSSVSSSASFSVPSKIGEYFYTLKCFTAKDSSFERIALIVDSSGGHFPDLNKWHASWIDSARIYEIFVRTLSLDGNIKAVTNRLSYIKSLGVNTIWLMPIYPGPPLSPSQPGYAISDYFNVNPAYGNLNDFKTFIDSAHSKGFKVILDYVVDHTSNIHPFMLDAFKYGSHSPYYDFYKWNIDGTYKYLYTWTDLPFINYELQRNRDYFMEAAKFWVENYNVDGFRCDAAAEVNDLHPGGSDFWQQFRSELKTIKPDILLLGELNAANLNYFDKKFDSGYDYSFFDNIKNAESNNNMLADFESAISSYLADNYPSYLIPFRYIENHDQARFISQYNLDETKLAATNLLTLPGLPMIYAGQEVGEQSYRGLINWQDPYNFSSFYKKLIGLRRDLKTLSYGNYKEIETSSPDSVFAFARTTDSANTLVVSNFTNGIVNARLNLDSLRFNIKPGKNYYLNDVLNNLGYPLNNFSNFDIELPGYHSAVLSLSDTIITSVDNTTISSNRFSLLQNYPNPFNPITTIKYSVGGQGTANVKLIIYNILGQKVKTLVNDFKSPGQYSTIWNGRNDNGIEVSSGVYLYLLKVKDFVETKKMIFLK
jgi:cyclomaltodextrinase / maltogenic alpha-amylase / neopullulanase